MTLNSIGLNQNKAKDLANDLNGLLANFQIYYQNLRGIHWNIKGKRFFDLHVKFEELYTDANVKVDEIAERILTLGETPLHTFEDYSKLAKVPVGKNVSQDEKAVRLIVDSLSELLQIERDILDKSGETNDEGTNSMMSDFITEQEKTVWMMKAWLGETV
ncbi:MULTISPECIES: Dps family protein [Xanthomarina]|jgi:starvation-inducible DNA-binding protein|uniref:Non-specific DNA-binding protein Dps n=1 Tax=Xanthomarina gelatinilytica TaxID=1137281 RepID=M7MGC1_9FLAO|nr:MULTISPECIES: Dps family protein [Xanthomarina]MCB0387448.1 DNA starvation/stationary phase protection protein [Winogradskyella sp.]EMQ93855.1 Non-specific DNA-binding protein Dps [Xanthomarina gelatinilytica]MBF62814.1 DNA starvation/stationary phase protection protein [Xanthomarina sp.]MDX1316808.1 Dps family protein [Xanthomarina gelatinilytica]HAB26971.1 DNA starvation/stationary phase protection protein [Xanthomarina gelatinilytica]|tara:strand:- start:1279 stop:1758 length:480 start_codon:yes stop_codon:yes gene_type:complete